MSPTKIHNNNNQYFISFFKNTESHTKFITLSEIIIKKEEKEMGGYNYNDTLLIKRSCSSARLAIFLACLDNIALVISLV